MPGVSRTIRFPPHILQAVDKNAARLGMTRTSYILSWLPETHTDDLNTSIRNANRGGDRRPYTDRVVLAPSDSSSRER